MQEKKPYKSAIVCLLGVGAIYLVKKLNLSGYH